MANYAKRTCVECGIRRSQPEMNRKTVYVETGHSKARLTTGTLIGTFLGDKASGRALNRAVWGNASRTYKRKKQVWLCDDCVSGYKPDGDSSSSGGFLSNLLGIILFIFLAGWIIDAFK